ncbi:Uncharacterised protein [Burkholderia pseudomallei]|nr:Uncharacterised protein [Burkholderia pseudomallei]
MSLTYNSRVIADARITNVNGARALGSGTLRINVEFRQPAWEATTSQASAVIQFGVLSLTTDAGGGGEIGRVYPDQPALLVSGPQSATVHQTFSIALSDSQLFALEEARKGGGVEFKLSIAASGHSTHGHQPIRDDIAHKMPLSEWARVLRELGHGDVIVLGVHLPTGRESFQLRSAIDLLHMANRHLINGEFDAVISRCRQAIESVQKVLDDGNSTRDAIALYKKDKQSMTTLQREHMIREMVRHYANPAHHVDDRGNTEYYGRADATFLLTLAAAAVTRASARAQVQERGTSV